MIGNFKPNMNKHEQWYSKSFSEKSFDAFNTYINYECFLIDVKTIDNKKYYHTFKKSYNTNLKTQAPIYHHK